MGRSVICNYQINVTLSNGKKLLSTQTCYGAMSYKQVEGIIRAENDYQKEKGVCVAYAEIWAQTAKGRKQLKKDYAIMTPDGKVSHYWINESVDFETNAATQTNVDVLSRGM